MLAHKEIRGLVVCCDECQQDHYHGWDMLRSKSVAAHRQPSARTKPAYDRTGLHCVTWDYCRGYADATNEAAPDADRFRRR